MQSVALAFVEGDDVRHVLDTLGPDVATERTTTFREAESQQDYESFNFAVQVEPLDGWTLLVEPNGYLSSLPEMLMELSLGRRAVSVHWNVNSQMQFQYAVDGVLERSFDPLIPELSPEGDPLPEEGGLRFHDENVDPRAEAIALAGRITGVTLDIPSVLGSRRQTWTVPSA